MKVASDSRFTPIVITIETKEEAHNLWHRLNIGDEQIRENSSDYKINETVSDNMFRLFDSIYTE